MKKREAQIQKSVCTYLKLAYPDVIFTSESGGIRLTIGQATKAKSLRSSAGLPDLWILEPRNGYHGLIIELKKDKSEVYLKDGITPKKDDHVKEQAQILTWLQGKGYYACFCFGFDGAKATIDKYMSNFNHKLLRRTLVNEEWYYSIEDVVQALTDTIDVKGYVKDLRRRDESLSEGWGQIATPLPFKTKGRGTKNKLC